MAHFNRLLWTVFFILRLFRGLGAFFYRVFAWCHWLLFGAGRDGAERGILAFLALFSLVGMMGGSALLALMEYLYHRVADNI